MDFIVEKAENIPICQKGTFIWAVEQMKNGRKLRRDSWKGNKNVIMSGRGYIVWSNKDSLPNLNFSSYEATDWEVVKEKKTLSDKVIYDSKLDSIYGPHRLIKEIIEIKDVKEALKKLYDKMPHVMDNPVTGLRLAPRVLIKEIFGDDLI